MAAFDLYKKLKGEINPLEPCLAFDLILQKLDRRGVNRSDMACNAALALRSLKPENSEQAAKMLELSNAFVERLSQCKLRTKDEIRTMILYSESLLPMIEGHEELKSATKALPQIYKDYM